MIIRIPFNLDTDDNELNELATYTENDGSLVIRMMMTIITTILLV